VLPQSDGAASQQAGHEEGFIVLGMFLISVVPGNSINLPLTSNSAKVRKERRNGFA
jgi:hypothetical protein